MCLALPALAAPPGQPTPPGPVCIAVVGTNDLHGAIEPYVIGNATDKVRTGGVLGLSGYVSNFRKHYGDRMVLVDGGDMFQGTLVSNMYQGRAVVDAYNLMGYTAAAVGNHEFDFGPLETLGREADGSPINSNDRLGALKERIAQAKFPFLTLNIFDRATDKRVTWPNTSPSILRDIGGVKVGILGISTPETPNVTKWENVSDLDFKDPVPLIIEEARALRSKGAKLVVLVGHVGGKCTNFDNPEDISSCQVPGDMEIIEIIKALPRGTIDVAVGGHTHQFIAHWVNGVATIESGARGNFVGWVDACLSPQGGIDMAQSTIHRATPLCLETWADGSCKKRKRPPLPVSQASFLGEKVAIEAPMQAAMQPYLDGVAGLANKLVGVTLTKPLDVSALCDLTAESMRRLTRADFGVQNKGGIRAGLPVGPVRYAQVFAVMPFDNEIILSRLNGAQVEKLAKMLMWRHGRPYAASLAGLRMVRGESGHFEVRTSKGARLEPDRMYTLAANDFIVTGGEGADAIFNRIPQSDKIDTDKTVLDALISQLQAVYPGAKAPTAK